MLIDTVVEDYAPSGPSCLYSLTNVALIVRYPRELKRERENVAIRYSRYNEKPYDVCENPNTYYNLDLYLDRNRKSYTRIHRSEIVQIKFQDSTQWVVVSRMYIAANEVVRRSSKVTTYVPMLVYLSNCDEISPTFSAVPLSAVCCVYLTGVEEGSPYIDLPGSLPVTEPTLARY